MSEACVVVNKLKGETVEGKGGICLKEALARVLGKKPALVEAVNRLDAPVTGCALFALTKEALAFLNSCFAGREGQSSPEKIYWAIAEKPPGGLDKFPRREIELTHWIKNNPKINKSIVRDKEEIGFKKALSRYEIIGEGERYLFIKARLLSGRHHQIRAQLAAIGLHIKGDLKYGAKRSEKGGGIRLHARSLSFPNPLDKSALITVTATPPEMDKLWEMFPIEKSSRI